MLLTLNTTVGGDLPSGELDESIFRSFVQTISRLAQHFLNCTAHILLNCKYEKSEMNSYRS